MTLRDTIIKSIGAAGIIALPLSEAQAYAPVKTKKHNIEINLSQLDYFTGLERFIQKLLNQHLKNKKPKPSKENDNGYDVDIYGYLPKPRDLLYHTHVQVTTTKKDKNDYQIFFNHFNHSYETATAFAIEGCENIFKIRIQEKSLKRPLHETHIEYTLIRPGKFRKRTMTLKGRDSSGKPIIDQKESMVKAYEINDLLDLKANLEARYLNNAYKQNP